VSGPQAAYWHVPLICLTAPGRLPRQQCHQHPNSFSRSNSWPQTSAWLHALLLRSLQHSLLHPTEIIMSTRDAMLILQVLLAFCCSVVNNAVYASYLQHARRQYLTLAMGSHDAASRESPIWALSELNMKYLRPLRWGPWVATSVVALLGKRLWSCLLCRGAL
jgi:hypothetical protein